MRRTTNDDIVMISANGNHNKYFAAIGNRSYNLLSRPFYERLVFYQLGGLKPDISEGIDMLKKSNDCE